MSQSFLRSSIVLRLFIAGVLCLFLLIPVALIMELINERQARRNEAVEEVTQKWGGAQTLIGPVLTVPTRWVVGTEKGKTIYEAGNVHYLPDSLKVNAVLVPTVRYRGIYKVVLYSARLTVRADFPLTDVARWAGKDMKLRCS